MTTSRSFLLLASCFLLLVSSPVRADWNLTTADAPTARRITVNEWTLKDGLSYAGEDGKLASMKARDVLALTAEQAKVAPSGNWVLALRNGDALLGEPVGLHGESLEFKTAELTIEVPLKAITGLRWRDAAKGTPLVATDKDVVRLKNGDLVEGILTDLTDSKVVIKTETAPADIELARVERLALGGAVPPRAIPALSVRLRFTGGSVLTVPEFHWLVGALTPQDPAGKERQCNTAQVASLEVLGGRIIWLTELDPARDEQVSSFPTSAWPTQTNLNVDGKPLKIGKTVFERGLGVHVKSALAYDLDGTFTTLTLRCGLDDSAAPYGEANLSIVLDGKTIWEAKGMKAGQLSEPLKLDIKGGRKLELRADPAGRLDVLGRVDWIDVALLRP